MTLDDGATCVDLSAAAAFCAWRCPSCGSADLVVADKRNRSHYIHRRKRCESCGARFTTRETLAAAEDCACET